MPPSYLTELALRAAVNTTNRTLTSDSNQTETLKTAALKCTQEFIKGNSDNTQMKAEAMAATLAIEGMLLAYKAVSKQIGVLTKQRLSFDQERQSGIATFMIPINKEARNLSAEEKVIKGFLELAFKNPSFSKYLGIHDAELSTAREVNFYSVLPFYRMSETIGQPLSSTRLLDRQRTANHLFLKSSFPDAIANVETSFQTDWKFVSFWESTFRGKNYLNNRRAPRFIMMCLSNLLWNLLHAVDPETGFPLNNNQIIVICRDVEIFLNQLLDPESPPYLKKISNNENSLLSFLRKIELSVKRLRAAYAEEQLHELNIEELSNSAHRALRIIDRNVFKLIYKQHNFISAKDEADDQAAEKIAHMISYLNQLLMQNNDLMYAFRFFPNWIPRRAGFNVPLLTIIDILIIFCHLSWRERDHLLVKLEKSNTEDAVEFAKTLRKFDQKFINPIKAVSKRELNATIFNPKHKQVGILTARRLIPLLTLVIQDYRVEIDTTKTSELANRTRGTPIRVYSGKEQILDINLSAQTDEGYYKWTLSPFVQMSAAVANATEELPKRQYRMTQLTELLDEVSELIKSYRSYLENPLFQAFLLKLLHKVKAENIALERHFDKIDECLTADKDMNRSLRAILHPMTKDINNSLDSFTFATNNLERKVSSPDFTDQERRKLSTLIDNISQQFSALFDEESGIRALVESTTNKTPVVQRAIAATVEMVESKKVIALIKLVRQCHNALSYQSRIGQKGMLLRELLTLIEDKPHFTEKQIKHVILELARVTASYRETSIFQASYGQTRSAQTLVAAIKDQQLNSILPLASIIFNKPKMKAFPTSDEQIIERLRNMREENRWQESSNKMKLIEFCK